MMVVAPEEVVQKYAFSHYGDLILVDDPIFDEEKKMYVSNLRSDYPLVVRDDRTPNKKSIRILKIDNLGTVLVNEGMEIVKATSTEECLNHLELSLGMWKKRAEEIVVSVSSGNLVRIPRFTHFFDPIDSILICLWDNDRVSDEDIKAARVTQRRRRMALYLGLLEGLQIVRRVEDGYVAGNSYTSIRQQTSKETEFRDAILAHIIRERYPTLRDVFRITILEPTIHVDNCVYLPELESEETIHRVSSSIKSDYEQYYRRRINPFDLKLTLRGLEDVEAISHDGEYYSGNESLLRKMVAAKKELPPISRDLLTRA